MKKQEKQKDIIFIFCPKCKGRSEKCRDCSKIGLGAFWNEVFLYCEFKITKQIIRLRFLQKLFNFLINLFAGIIGLAGLISLSWWIWQNNGINQWNIFLFWDFQHELLFIFWISVLADMFLVYKLWGSKFKILLKHKIKQNKIKSMPNNWNELKKHKKINIAEAFNKDVIKIIETSFWTANKLKHDYISTTHLFFALLKNKKVSSFFFRLNVDRQKLIDKIKNSLIKIEEETEETAAGHLSASADRCPAAVSSSVKQVFILAYINACKSGQAEMRSLNLILPIVKQDKNLLEILYDLEIDENKIINTIKWFEIDNILLEDYKIYQKSAKLKPGTTMDRAYTAISTPVLDSISYDLTLMAKQGRLEFCVNRDKEIQEIFQVLESERCGALLTGSVGTGKRAIINGIARLMVREKVPKFLKDKRLIELDAARLISGADAVMAEERLLVIIDEINKAGNIILFIENIENIVGISSGQEQSLELSEVLTGAINRKELYCLATVEAQNYVRYIEGKPLGNAMSIIKIQEPNINQAIQMIESKINRFENKYQIYFSYNSIEQAVQLSSKYINDKYLPEKAINILEATAVRLSGQRLQNAQKYMCSKNDIAETISKITGIPLSDITDIESEKLLNLEKYIHKRMINQNEAVNMVSDSLRRARAALNSGKRPIANFLFLGPTGVGKTELAKTVAEVYFGNENYMIRLDMSEYQHADSIEKMIGSAGGIKGQLTEAVRKQPFSLILLDEFEKSHPDILNLFLQVMDDGRLTDGQGNTINFTNSIIIATSNAGALYIQEQIANNHGLNIDMQKLKQTLINEHLNKIMRPELINRFDGVIVFKPLTIENIRVITKLMLKKIVKALEAKGIGMKMEEQGIYKLAQEGYDPKFGARPLRRLLQDKIANQIAKKILSKELARRDIVIINEIGGVDIEKAREL